MAKEFVQMYNYIGEFSSLLMAGLLLFVMLYTKPKKSFVYRYLFIGNLLAIIAIIIQLSICIVVNHADEFYNRYLFKAQLIAFLLVYNGVLYFIFSYVNMMSLARRRQRKEFLLMYFVLTFAYAAGMILVIATRGFYTFEVYGIDISHFTRFYCVAGIVCAIVCYYATLSNRSSVSRVIWHTVCLFVPVDIIILFFQIILIGRYHTVFSGLTYVPVFILAFFLFHNVPYDEVTGCNSQNALDEYLSKNVDRRKFYQMYLEFKMPTNDSFMVEDEEIHYIGVNACRSIESISRKIKMFKLETQKYVNIIDCDDESEAMRYADQIRGVMDGVKAELKVPFNYIIIVGEITDQLKEPVKIRQLYEYVADKFADQNTSYFYTIKPEDYADFAEVYDVIFALKDIRNRSDYDDERVVVYAQPIYSVDKHSFRVAEALMRIKINDRIIYPDKFIPAAEASGCVHMLTLIILNKVCKAVSRLDKEYDFDAISINVSSKELSHETMYQDLLDIIEKYDIDVKKIRMEITETAMFENYELANRNMEILNRQGIQLYLDDFGTGYSSLERVMNCPIKTIKFDKALLYKSLDDNRMDDILSYLIEVLKKNGFVTLVEGVEDESQSKYSVDRGFDYIQGYHYAKPEPIENLGKFFTKKTGS